MDHLPALPLRCLVLHHQRSKMDLWVICLLSFNFLSSFKRGLSKHFQGKSQSFTSLSSVTCLDDLAKPENPYHKKLKSCKTYVGNLSEATHRSSTQPNLKSPASATAKKSTSRVSWCSNALGAKRNYGSFIGNAMRPPTHPPHHSSNSAANFNQTPLFA